MKFELDNRILLQNKSLHYIFMCLIMWCGTYSLMRGWMEIHPWAHVNWLITYEWGFFKRGLWGTLVSPFIDPSKTPDQIKETLTNIGLPIFILFISILVYVSIWTIKKRKMDWKILLIFLVFFTSPYMTMLGNIRNYLDIKIGVLGILSIACILKDKWIIATLLLMIATLIHEITVVIYGPLTVFCIASKQTIQGAGLNPFAWPKKSLLPCIVPAALVLYIVTFQQSIPKDEYNALLEAKFAQTLGLNSELSQIFADMFTHSFLEYIKEELPKFLNRLQAPEYALPILSFLLLCQVKLFQILKESGTKKAIVLSLIGGIATLSPLALHAIAFDTARIWTMPMLSSFLTLWIATALTKPIHDNGDIDVLSLLFLCLWMIYWLIDPIVMIGNDIIDLYTDDAIKAATIPVLVTSIIMVQFSRERETTRRWE